MLEQPVLGIIQVLAGMFCAKKKHYMRYGICMALKCRHTTAYWCSRVIFTVIRCCAYSSALTPHPRDETTHVANACMRD